MSLIDSDRRSQEEAQDRQFPIENVEVTSEGLVLKGNFVQAPLSVDAALILHGAAAKGDPLINLVPIQQLFAKKGISSLAIRLRGVGEADNKSEGEYNVSLLRRYADGINAFNYLRERLGEIRLHLVAGSMNAEIGALMAQRLQNRIRSLELVAPAAYPRNAREFSLGPDFSEIIRDEHKNLIDAAAFEEVDTYPGRVAVAYGEEDVVIDKIVQHQYAQRGRDKGMVLSVAGVGHQLLSNTSHPGVIQMYIEFAGFMKQV